MDLLLVETDACVSITAPCVSDTGVAVLGTDGGVLDTRGAARAGYKKSREMFYEPNHKRSGLTQQGVRVQGVWCRQDWGTLSSSRKGTAHFPSEKKRNSNQE